MQPHTAFPPAPSPGNAPEPNSHVHRRRIVLTGGPGGGKTTALDLMRRELMDRCVIVPEAATMLYSGGFPRYSEAKAQKVAQRVIFHVQKSLEELQAAHCPHRVLLCDRGTVDGAAYWPGDPEQLFTSFGTSIEKERARYDGVLFFESASVGGLRIEDGNPARIESIAEAAALDARLRALWCEHPRFVLIPHTRSFFLKVRSGLDALERLLEVLEP